MITAVIVGREEMIASFRTLPVRASDALRQDVTALAIDLVRHIKQDKLSGQVLKNRTGTLRRSINYRVEESDGLITAVVGTNVVYARIQEYGGKTRAHVIVPKNAKALSWVKGDKRFFAKIVHHPGSKIPERSFLRSALEDMQSTIRERLTTALERAING